MATIADTALSRRADDAAPLSETLILHCATGMASAAIALATAASRAPYAQGWRAPLIPDLASVINRAGAFEPSVAAIVGFAFGALVSTMLPTRGGPVSAVIRFLAILNPAVFAATAAGPAALLLATASLVFWRGVFPLGGEADYRTPILAAVAVAAAPLIANPVLVFYPAFFVLAPLLSPWGLAPRRVLGFATVVFAPLFMIAAGAAYIAWLFPSPYAPQGAALAFTYSVSASDFAPLLAAPGPMIALLFAPARTRIAGLIFLASALAALSIAAGAGLAAAPVAGAVAAAHIAWICVQSRRPAVLLGLGFAGGAVAAMIAQGWPAP